MRRFILMLLFSVLFFPLLPRVSAAAPAGQAASCSNTLYAVDGQSFWVGDVTPSNQDGEVIVFVHGYSRNHTDWTSGNVALQEACEQGFRTAAVDLEPHGSIWANARELKGELEAITAYYGVAAVNVVGHSKGGLDTQTAIVHSAAFPLVSSFIALGSPFGGTELADFACSPLGQPLGLCNPATSNMRTAYMTFVRAVTDGRPQNDGVAGYLVRGTHCTPFPLSIACVLIPGEDDGIVPAWSAFGTTEATPLQDRADLDHLELHLFQNYDDSIFAPFTEAAASAPVAPTASPATRFASSDYGVRGGSLAGPSVVHIPVEAGLSEVSFRLLSSRLARVSIVGPDGTRLDGGTLPTAADALLHGFVHEARVAQPAAGVWRVITTPTRPRAQGAFLLQVGYQGGVTMHLETNLGRLYAPGSTLPLSVTLDGAVAEGALRARLTSADSEATVVGEAQGALRGTTLALPRVPGVYNLEVRVTGTLADGSAFERTIVTSVAVVDIAAVGDPARIR